MSKEKADAAENDFPFPTRSFIFGAVMLFSVAGICIFLSVFENLQVRITAMALCVNTWVASPMHHVPSDVLQLYWSPANGVWSLPDGMMIVLLVAFAFFGVLVCRVDIDEMLEKNGDATEDDLQCPSHSFILATVMSSSVATFTFSAALKDLCDHIITNAICLSVGVASLAQQASAVPDIMMIVLIIAFAFLGFMVSRIGMHEMSNENMDAAKTWLSCPTRSLIFIVLVLSLVMIAFTSSAALNDFEEVKAMQLIHALPDGVMIALIVAFAFFGFVVSRHDVYEMSEDNAEAPVDGLQFPLPLLVSVALMAVFTVVLALSAALKSLLFQVMATSLYVDAWVAFALVAFTCIGGAIMQADYHDIRAELESSECAK
jgi:hypothetical protein